MYKVFIENKEVQFDCKSEKELLSEFKDYQFIEAAGGIVTYQNKLLFIKRNGFWDIPKGKLDKGESPEEGAVREIEEECGLNQPKIIKHLLNTWHTYVLKNKKVIKKTYWYLLEASEKELKLVPQMEEGITEVRLFDKNNLSEIKSNTFDSIIQVIATIE